MTNKESLFASYSTWLLLALKANRRACSISNPSGPSKMTPSPLPSKFEEPSTESTHLKPAPSWCVARGELYYKVNVNLARNGALGSYCTSNSDSSTPHLTILPATSGFYKTLRIGRSVITITVKLCK